MTLQVAFVAANGFVIASDEKSTAGDMIRRQGDMPPASIRRTNTVHKILISENQSLVCAFSVNDISAFVAQRLIESSPKKFRDERELAAHLAQASRFAHLFSGDSARGQIVIAGIPNPPPNVNRLWRVLLMDDALVLPIQDKLYAGDMSNVAVFFGERYYSASLSLKTLTFLAAHIILEGHRQNGLHVDGLEILVSEDGKEPTFLMVDELNALRDQSDAITQKLADLLLRWD